LPALSPSDQIVTLQAAEHYALAQCLGLHYGPSFQGVAEIRITGDKLEAKFALARSIALDCSYVLHPAILDLCYQSLVDFFQSDISAGKGVALLPVKMGKLFVRNSLAGSVRQIDCFRAQLRRQSARSVLADFELLDKTGNVFAAAYGCRFRAAPLGKQAVVQQNYWQTVSKLCPHPTEARATDLPPPSELARAIDEWLSLNESTLGRRSWFKESLPLFEALVLSFAAEAFSALLQNESQWMQTQLSNPTAPPLVRWLAHLLRQEGLLVQADSQWQLVGELPAAAEIWRTLYRDMPTSLPQLALIGHAGARLPDFLAGRIDTAAFVAQMRQLANFEILQEEDPAYRGTHLAIEQTLVRLAAGLPSHRPLRILEIAVNGSEIPHKLCRILPEDRLHYTLGVLDVGASERCQAEYQDVPNVVVADVDISIGHLTSSRPTRLIPEHFDVLVLRHVLHRATHPKSLLTQAKRLLAQGGLLLIAEQHPDWSADFLFGIDPAWWHEDSNCVPLSPLMAPHAWEAVLREEAFEEITLAAEPAADGLAEGAYLLLAKTSSQQKHTALPTPSASWLLLADDASAYCIEQLRLRMESAGQRVTIADTVPTDTTHAFDHWVFVRGWETKVDETFAIPGQLLAMLKGAAGQVKPPHVWIVTHGGALASQPEKTPPKNPVQAALWGMGRVAMNELPTLNSTLIDVAGDIRSAKLPERLEQELLHPDGLEEILLTDEARFALSVKARAEETNAPPCERFRLDFHLPGKLANLRWLPAVERRLQDHEIEVQPKAVGLNFRDVMYLMGLLPDEAVENGFAGASLGLEFSGVVTRVGAQVHDLAPGDAVMGFGPACFASNIVTREDAVARMPTEWSFEAAATVPTVFLTVYYALKHLADLQPGERVLIHGAAGGVGLAAIQLAKHLGAEIWATAGSEEKRDFVRLLGAQHVFDSRSLSFADDVLNATGGSGVDVVLNSLAGEAIRRNLSILKPFGRFLELGKRDFSKTRRSACARSRTTSAISA